MKSYGLVDSAKIIHKKNFVFQFLSVEKSQLQYTVCIDTHEKRFFIHIHYSEAKQLQN